MTQAGAGPHCSTAPPAPAAGVRETGVSVETSDHADAGGDGGGVGDGDGGRDCDDGGVVVVVWCCGGVAPSPGGEECWSPVSRRPPTRPHSGPHRGQTL